MIESELSKASREIRERFIRDHSTVYIALVYACDLIAVYEERLKVQASTIDSLQEEIEENYKYFGTQTQLRKDA